MENPRDWSLRNIKSRWSRDPQAQAVETIHQASGHTVAQTNTYTNDDVCRPVLIRQQVRQSPRGKRCHRPPDQVASVAHIHLAASVCYEQERRAAGSPPIAFLMLLGQFEFKQKPTDASL